MPEKLPRQRPVLGELALRDRAAERAQLGPILRAAERCADRDRRREGKRHAGDAKRRELAAVRFRTPCDGMREPDHGHEIPVAIIERIGRAGEEPARKCAARRRAPQANEQRRERRGQRALIRQ